MENHPSVHERLTRLENAVQMLEERDQANLRRIEQLASRVRELEQSDTQRPLAEYQANLRRIKRLASRVREMEQSDTQRPLAE